MNISNIDVAPPESKALSLKTDTEGTDLFSILMASITAENSIQHGNYNVTADGGGPSLTGQVTFSTVDVTPSGQDAGLASPASFPVESSTAKGLTAQDTSSVFAIPDIAEGSDNNAVKTGDDVIMGELANPRQTVDSLKPLIAGEVAKGPSDGVPYLTPEKIANGETGDGIEVKEVNVNIGAIASGNDKAETGKGSDVGDGIVTAFGRESINPGLLHASAETLPESDPALRNIHRPQIDPVDLVAQVSGKIKADFNSEGGEVRMELHPESLGHLKIEIKVEGGVISANILTENAMVKDSIDSNLSMLRSSLEEHGLRIDQLSVGVGHQHSRNAFAERKDVQMWQGFENADSSRYEGEEPVNESWYSVDSWQEQGVNIFA